MCEYYWCVARPRAWIHRGWSAYLLSSIRFRKHERSVFCILRERKKRQELRCGREVYVSFYLFLDRYPLLRKYRKQVLVRTVHKYCSYYPEADAARERKNTLYTHTDLLYTVWFVNSDILIFYCEHRTGTASRSLPLSYRSSCSPIVLAYRTTTRNILHSLITDMCTLSDAETPARTVPFCRQRRRRRRCRCHALFRTRPSLYDCNELFVLHPRYLMFYIVVSRRVRCITYALFFVFFGLFDYSPVRQERQLFTENGNRRTDACARALTIPAAAPRQRKRSECKPSNIVHHARS